MIRNENQTFGEMLKVAQARLRGRSSEDIAEKTGLEWDGARSRFHLNSLGREVEILWPDLSPAMQLEPWYQLVILHYMDQASGLFPARALIPFAAQPGGMVRGGGFDRECEQIIRTRLGKCDPEALEQACLRLGARILSSNADLCAEFALLPRYPLTLKIWFADDEMEASGRMFLDENAPACLSVEDSVTAGTLILDALVRMTCTEVKT